MPGAPPDSACIQHARATVTASLHKGRRTGLRLPGEQEESMPSRSHRRPERAITPCVRFWTGCAFGAAATLAVTLLLPLAALAVGSMLVVMLVCRRVFRACHVSRRPGARTVGL